jgi:hypothetical protein
MRAEQAGSAQLGCQYHGNRHGLSGGPDPAPGDGREQAGVLDRPQFPATPSRHDHVGHDERRFQQARDCTPVIAAAHDAAGDE